MPRPQRLDAAEITRRLQGLPGWELKDGKLHRGFAFPDFAEAFRFMTALAAEAERLQHHPEWCNVYNRVTMDLVTHDAGGHHRAGLRAGGPRAALAGRRAVTGRVAIVAGGTGALGQSVASQLPRGGSDRVHPLRRAGRARGATDTARRRRRATSRRARRRHRRGRLRRVCQGRPRRPRAGRRPRQRCRRLRGWRSRLDAARRMATHADAQPHARRHRQPGRAPRR